MAWCWPFRSPSTTSVSRLVRICFASKAEEKVLTAASRETCKVLLFHFCTGANDGRGDSLRLSTQTHDFKDFLDCPKHGSQDETTDVWGQSVDAEVTADVDLEILGEVHKKNIDEKLRIVERGNVVGQAVGSSVLSPDNLQRGGRRWWSQSSRGERSHF